MPGRLKHYDPDEPKPKKGPKWSEIAPDPTTGVLGNRIEWREGRVVRRHSASGRSTVTLCCPFCNSHITAYVWSLSGGGKRCYCGALAGRSGTFYHYADRSA